MVVLMVSVVMMVTGLGATDDSVVVGDEGRSTDDCTTGEYLPDEIRSAIVLGGQCSPLGSEAEKL